MARVLSYCIFEIKHNPLCTCEGLPPVTRNYGGNIVTGAVVPLDLSMQFQAWQPAANATVHRLRPQLWGHSREGLFGKQRNREKIIQINHSFKQRQLRALQARDRRRQIHCRPCTHRRVKRRRGSAHKRCEAATISPLLQKYGCWGSRRARGGAYRGSGAEGQGETLPGGAARPGAARSSELRPPLRQMTDTRTAATTPRTPTHPSNTATAPRFRLLSPLLHFQEHSGRPFWPASQGGHRSRPTAAAVHCPFARERATTHPAQGHPRGPGRC